jgi:hypothetical protein
VFKKQVNNMSIKLKFEAGSISMQAILKDSALPDLLALIAANMDEVSPQAAQQPLDDGPNSKLPDRVGLVKHWMQQHVGSEVLNLIGWETNPEKILLLAAHFESTGGQEGWKNADMEIRFSAAKESPPSNFPRDISNAIKANWIASVTPRTYKVSRAGWNKIADKVIELEKI